MRYQGHLSWEDLARELERQAERASSDSERSRLYLEAGKVWGDVLLSKGEAMTRFQLAVKHDPTCRDALSKAREIYVQMGKLNMIGKLIDIELKSVETPAERASLLKEKAWSLLISGKLQAASEALTDAQAADPQDEESTDLLGDLLDQEDLYSQAMQMEQQLTTVASDDREAAVMFLLRAGLLYRRDDELTNALRCIEQACRISQRDPRAMLLFEETALQAGNRQLIDRLQSGLVQTTSDDDSRLDLLLEFASRTILRFEDMSRAAELLGMALDIRPDHEGAFSIASQVWREQEEGWVRLALYAEKGASAASEPDAKKYFLTQAMDIYESKLQDSEKAARLGARLAELDPTPTLAAGSEREAKAADRGATQEDVVMQDTDEKGVVNQDGTEDSETSDEGSISVEVETVSQEEQDDGMKGPGESSGDSLWLEPTPEIHALIEKARGLGDNQTKQLAAWRDVINKVARTEEAFAGILRICGETDKWNYAVEAHKKIIGDLPEDMVQAKVEMMLSMARLYREKMNQETSSISVYQQVLKVDQAQPEAMQTLLEIYERMNRWPDYVKLLAQKAELAADPAARVAGLLEVAQLYLERFNNQGEAMKCYERVMEIQPDNETASSYLIQMYEKRRDWEKLINLSLGRIKDDPAAHFDELVELAIMADERLRKPPVSIDLWSQVLSIDENHSQAIDALSMLYERAREWNILATILRKQADKETDDNQRKQILLKLGLLYTDKVQDDPAAVVTWKELLALDPNERRAVDQLKKRYMSMGAWDDLEAFYEETGGKWDELVRLLEREADGKEGEPRSRIEIMYRVARILRTRIESMDKCAAALEKVIQIDPEEIEAAEQLIPIYEGSGNFARLAAMLEIKMGKIDDAQDRFDMMVQLGTIFRDNIGDASATFDWLVKALSTMPSHLDEVTEPLEAAAEESGRWGDLEQVYRKLLETADDKDGIRIKLLMGNVIHGHLKEAERALVLYNEVLGVDEDNPEALEKVETIYGELGRFDALQAVLERRLELTSSPEEKLALRRKVAAIYDEALGDRTKAIEAYVQILDDNGDDLQTLVALGQLLEAEKRYKDLLDVIERQMGLSAPGSDEYIERLFSRGKLCEERLDNVTQAIESYRDILAIRPEHEPSMKALERFIEDDAHKGEVARLLEPILAQNEDWQNLSRCLLILADEAEENADKVDYLRRVSEIYIDKLSSPEQAFVTNGRALRHDPASEEIMADLEQIAEVLDAYKDLDDLLTDIVHKTQVDDSVRKHLWFKVAQVRHTKMDGQTDGAIEAYRKVIGFDPGNLDALNALELLYQDTENWQELQDVYKQKIDVVVAEEEKLQIHFRLAMLYTDMLDAPEEAIHAYREVLNLRPDDMEALTSLEKLFERLERWTDLADNLQAQLDLVPDSNKVTSLRLRLGSLRENKMGETESAIETYREILSSDPSNDEAIVALERLIRIEEHESTVAEILEPIYRERQDWQHIIQIDEIFIKHGDSTERKVELLCQMGEMYELAGDDPEKAFEAYSRALMEDPISEVVQTNLDRLARILDLMKDVIKVYEAAIEKIEDPELKTGLHRKVAVLYEIEAGDLEGAIRHYKAIISIDPASIEAIEALERIYTASERYAELASINKQKASVVADPDEKKALYLAAGRIYEEMLEDVDSAVTTYATILEFDPEDQEALDKLAHLYSVKEKWTELLEVLQAKADLVIDIDEKKAIQFNAGEVYLEKLEDVEHAIDSFIKVTELDPDDVNSLRKLDGIYTRTGKHAELLPIVQREAELALDPNENIEFRHRMGKLHEEHLDDVPKAIETYRDILHVMPDYAPSILALEGLIAQGKEASLAAMVLEPIHDANAEWEKLVSVLEVQLAAHEDHWERVGLLHRIATYQEDERYIGNTRAAFSTYARALSEDPRNEDTLSALERIAENLRNWQDLASEYDRVIGQIEDADIHVIIGLRAARVYEEELGNPEASIAHYKKVVGADDRNAVAIHSLSRLYRVNQRWEELLGILDLEMDISGTEEEALELKFMKAQICYQELGRVGDALAIYNEILGVNPEHNQTHAALELLFDEGIERKKIFDILQPLHEMAGEWEKLCVKEQALANDSEVPAERMECFFNIATIYETKMLDGDQAFDWYGKAYMVDPTHERAMIELDRLADALGEWPKYVELLQQVLSTTETKEIQLTVGKKMARILEDHMMDPDRAREVYNYLVGIDSTDREVLEPLDRLNTLSMDWGPLATVLEYRIAAEQEDEPKIELLTRYGELLQKELGRLDDAVKAYRRIVDDLSTPHPPALSGLEVIYLEQGKWKELYAILEKQIDTLLSESDQADVYAKMANVASMGLEDPEKAIELWNHVLDIKGDDPEALEALGELYHGLERWSDLVDVLERGIMALMDDQDRIRMYEKLGRIWSEKLERDGSALECWDNILAIEPGNVKALMEKAEIFSRMEEWEDLIDTLNQITDFGVATLDDHELRSVYARQAMVYTQKLDRPLDAIEAWQKVLKIDPADMEAIEALEVLYSKEEMWEEYVSIRSRKAPLMEEEDARIQLWLDVANVWVDKLLSPANAAESYEEILQIDAGHDVAFAELEKLYTELENPSALIQVYLNRYEVVSSTPAKTDLLLRAAKQYEDAVGDEESSFLIIQKAYMEDFTNPRAVSEVERITAKIGRWEELIGVVNTKLAELGNRSEASPLYLQVGRWYGERLGNLQYATACYGKVLQMDPSNIGALSAIADLYKNAGQWDNYVHYLKMQAEKASSEDVRKEIMVKLGRTYDEELARPDDAIDAFRQALAIDPKHPEALDSIEVLYRTKEMYKDLIGVLKSKLGIIEEDAQPERRVELLMALGDVYEEHTGEPLPAVKCYQQVIELDDGNMNALKGLERLFVQMEKWQDLLDVLEMQYNITQIEKDKVDLQTRMAQMLEKEFLKPESAIEKYEQVLMLDPDNQNALENLERIYRKEKRFDDLVETYARHVMVVEEDEKRIDLLLAQGRICIEELENSDRGIESYRKVLEIDESHPQSLDILARLYDHEERFSEAFEVIERLHRVTLEPTAKVELLYRMGVILDQQLGDRDAAVDKFQEAMNIDPGHLECLGALRTIYIEQEEWGLAEQILDREQQNTTVPMQRSELLYARGRILRDYLNREQEAIVCFEEAIKLDGENEEAAEPLVEHYLVNNLYPQAEPLLDMLLRKWEKKPPEELLPYYMSLATVAEAVGNDEKALRSYRSAFEIDASNIEVLKGMAGILYKLQQWDKAFKYFQMILVQHIDSQEDSDKVDIYYHLGNIKINVNEPRKALNMYEKALGIDQYHRPTLEALIGLFEKQRDFEQVIHFKKTIAESLSGDEKFDMLVEIGDIWQDKLSNSAKAISSYNDALQLKPDDRTLLHRLMTQYSNTKQWAKAVEVLKQVAEMEEDTQRKARYYHSIAIIYHQEIKDSDTAIEHFNLALDSDPDNLKDFEAIEQILTPRRDWKLLERNYRKMLHRITGRDKKQLEEALWHGLGEIYRTRMQNYEAAAEAFKMASALSPDNQLRHEILAELYTIMPERWQDAVKEHQFLIRQNPNRVDSYKALRRIYQDNRQYDKAWCLCSTLNFLKKADAEEQRFFEQYRMKGMARAQQPLDNENWIKNLFHHDEDPYIGKVFEVCTNVVRPRKLQPQKAYGLKKKDKKDPFTSTEAFARIFGTVVRVLNLPLPELYVRYDQPFGLQYAITDPPASVVGQALLSGYTPQDLTFIIAKHLTYYRGEHYIRLLEPTTGGLKALLLASMKATLPNFQIPADIQGQIMPVVQVLQSSLLPVQAEQLKRVVRAFSESKASADLKRWASAVELTSCRSGLLLCNDLEVAVRMINAEPPGFSDVPPKDKIMQLILFSVSEEYFRLRESLGITIGT